MATKTAGTNGTTTFANALQSAGPSSAGLPAPADIGTLNNAILSDYSPQGLAVGGVGANMQTLTIPGRGTLKVLPNDWIGVSPSGFPYLIPAIDMATTAAINGTPVSTTKTMVMASSVIAAGWVQGGNISGTGIAVGTTITNISADGLTVTMSLAATSSPGATAVTYGNWTHS